MKDNNRSNKKKNNNQKGNKIGKIIGIIITAILVLCAVVVLGARLYFRIPVADYYKASEKAFIIPGLSDGFVPQGLCYEEESDCFYVTGYMNDGSASPIYIIDKFGNIIKQTRLHLADGSDYTGHAGGISVNGDYIYIAGGHDNCLYVYNKSSFEKGELEGIFSLQKSEDDYVGVAFTTISNGFLIAGEFYRDPNYPTLDSHKITTKGGNYNQALAVAFELDDSYQYGINPQPVLAMSLPDLDQGMVIDGDIAYVSTSYGTPSSYIYEYYLSDADSGEMIEVLGENIPRYDLDESSMIDAHKIAPMSEELAIRDGRLYVMCESASKKYVFGNFTGAKWCYSTKLNEW